MHGVGPGSNLGRYVIGRRLSSRPGTDERWTATDPSRDQDVILTVIDPSAPHLAAALDAARRAAGIELPQLVRILDVDRDESAAWVAEEAIAGRTFAAAIGRAGLPPEEVRRVTGEIATALEVARGRGVHHLALNPESVLMADDGRVLVRGLGTDGALDGHDEEGERAARTDAVATVALTYAGLTGRWPLSTESGGLPPAHRTDDGVAAPSLLAVGVPRDLDDLCREVLDEDQGPQTPGAIARLIGPWETTPANPAPISAVPPPPSPPSTPAAVPPPPPTPGAAPSTNEAEDDGGKGASVAAAGGAAVAAVAGAGKAVTDKISQFARSARDKAEDVRAERSAQRETLRAAENNDQVSLDQAGTSSDLEPPAPLLPSGSGAMPNQTQQRAVLWLMVAFVVGALVIGLIGVSRIGANTNLDAIFGSDATAPSTTTSRTSSTTPSSSPGTKQGEQLAIIKAVGYDPAGDGVERNADAPRVYDGNPSTIWQSEGYNDPNFGNKPGVGIVVDLGQEQSIGSVTLTLPSTARATVYAADQPANSGPSVGNTGGRSGNVTLTPNEPITARYVTVWFTTTAPGDDGRHRASLAEIVVRAP